jgi:hypothetical protein
MNTPPGEQKGTFRCSFVSVGVCHGVHLCDDTGWVCEDHADRPLKGDSKRADACLSEPESMPALQP